MHTYDNQNLCIARPSMWGPILRYKVDMPMAMLWRSILESYLFYKLY